VGAERIGVARKVQPRKAVVMNFRWLGRLILLVLPGGLATLSAEEKPISYYRQIRPILQAACHGCHQPAKAKGNYVMTSHDLLLKGGEDDGVAVVPGKPEESSLMRNILPHEGGKPEMPKNAEPLAKPEVDLIGRWIAEGALDDTPPNVMVRHDAGRPPVYLRPPSLDAVAWSPDGQWIAVTGFHEILLHRADGSGLVRRLIGLSERLTSLSFSKDGKYLAATGGLPARMGELQVWKIPSGELQLSWPATADTVYGVSWSPDGKLLAFGCAADKSVRAIDLEAGRQVLFMASHDDWVLDTVFSVKGDHVISCGRDMSAKLTELATERFVDNLTSITPGALKGGLAGIARHPLRDEILVGGADGVPQVYRVFREVQRRIGDNSNLIRRYPPMEGRIWAVDYSPDGKRMLAAASMDGKGSLAVGKAEYDPVLPERIKGIFGKVSTSRSPEENAAVEAWQTEGAEILKSVTFPAGIYAARFSPDGSLIAAAGQSGSVIVLRSDDLSEVRQFVAVPLSAGVVVPAQR